MTRDAADENMVLSGGRDERDNYKISSGSQFFLLKISWWSFSGHLNFNYFFFAI